MTTKPTFDQVIEVLRRADRAFGWIGEGDEIVENLLEYIDGTDDSFAEWAMTICVQCGWSPGGTQKKHPDFCLTQKVGP